MEERKMFIQETKQYFESKGGKAGVASSDKIWNVLIKFYNSEHTRAQQLSSGCGSCRSTAYKWLISLND